MTPNTMAYSGLTMGAGTAYSISSIAGLLDLPEVRSADRVRLRRHGALAGDDFAGVREIEIELVLVGDGLDDTSFAAALDALLAATRIGRAELPLTFRIPGVAGGGDRLVYARPRKRELLLDPERMAARVPEIVLQLVATDPRLYDATEGTGLSTLPTAGGGLEFPLDFDLTFGAVSTGGTITAVNVGTFPTSPTFRIDGPITNPRIENVTAGKTLALNITLLTGEWLDIDTEARTILLGGTASRYSSLAVGSEWWDLEPGTSEVTFRATTPTAATLSMTWRSAWL